MQDRAVDLAVASATSGLRSAQRFVVRDCPRGVPEANAPGWAEGADSVDRCSERRRIVELAAAFGLPLPPLAAVAGGPFAGPFDLGGGELEAGPDLIGLDLGD